MVGPSLVRKSRPVQVVVFFTLSLALPALRAGAQKTPPDLSAASLEDLMNVEVTSVAKKEQKLSKVAAAIFVISQENIRRSGATTVPDLLRIVPGMDVAQINSNTWAISARGFNGQFADKLLVLIDGRAVYDPSFSGVYWDAQDLVLEDVERIEVIRGPGATVWGANAVNGVINIITKSSTRTQGTLMGGGGGTVEEGSGSLRYGGKIGKRGHYRVFGRYFNRGSFSDPSGRNAADGWDMRHSGFRTDWDLSERDSMTVEGDIYRGIKGEPYPAGPSLVPPFSSSPFTSIKDYSGGNALARWSHTLKGGSQMALQTYFDRITRVDSTEPELRNTFDLDFRHHLTLGSRHDIVWGGGVRRNADHLAGSFRVSFNPPRFASAIENLFMQDEIDLVGDALWLTVGTKVEHNEFTGAEVQPSARLLWRRSDRDTLWLAYSRADRVPTRADDQLRVNVAAFPISSGNVALLSLFGNARLKANELNAYEFGYRAEPTRRISLDIATFYNTYRALFTAEPGTPFFEAAPPPPHLVIPLTFANNMLGSTYGAEVSAEWKAAKFWTLGAGYTWLVPSLKVRPGSLDLAALSSAAGSAPRNQFQLRSELDLPHDFEFDASVYRVGRLGSGNIPAYTRLDARLGWRLAERMELSIVGQNLVDPRHLEFNARDQAFVTTQLMRAAYAEIRWRF